MWSYVHDLLLNQLMGATMPGEEMYAQFAHTNRKHMDNNMLEQSDLQFHPSLLLSVRQRSSDYGVNMFLSKKLFIALLVIESKF